MKNAFLSYSLSMMRGALLGAVLLVAQLAHGQAYPSKPITVIVPFAAGTVSDLVFRSVGSNMAKALPGSVIVENRPGGNGIIAWEYVVKRQPADGYTLAGSTNSNLTLSVFTKDLPLDPVNDLVPVAIVAESPLVIHSPANAPWNTMEEMVAYAKANPGKLNWGGAGTTSFTALNAVAITNRDNLNIVQVPFVGGNNQAIISLLANDIQLLFSTVVEATPNLLAKKTKGLGWTGETRIAAFPNIPTLAELGYPGQAGVWWAINVRPGTPKPIIDRLNAAARNAVQQADVKEFFSKNGFIAGEATPENAAKRYETIHKQYKEIALKAGLKPQ